MPECTNLILAASVVNLVIFERYLASKVIIKKCIYVRQTWVLKDKINMTSKCKRKRALYQS